MAENSDYENHLHNQEIQKGLGLISYLVCLPLGWFFYPFESVSVWISVIVFLFFPYLIGSLLMKLIKRFN
jgi:hypothetical protein